MSLPLAFKTTLDTVPAALLTFTRRRASRSGEGGCRRRS